MTLNHSFNPIGHKKRLLLLILLGTCVSIFGQKKEFEFHIGFEIAPTELIVPRKIGVRTTCGCFFTWCTCSERDQFEDSQISQISSGSFLFHLKFPARRSKIHHGLGLGLSYTRFVIQPSSSDLKSFSQSTMGHIFYSFNQKWIEARVGLSFGASAGLRFVDEDQEDLQSGTGIIDNFNTFPIFGFKTGLLEKLDFQFGVNAYQPLVPSWRKVSTSVGIYAPLFGSRNKSGIRIGYDNSGDAAHNCLIQAEIAIKNKFFLIPVARIGQYNSYGFSFRLDFEPAGKP